LFEILQAKLKAELEALRKREEERLRIEVKLARLRASKVCPNGFSWYPEGNGFRCGGGSHFTYMQ